MCRDCRGGRATGPGMQRACAGWYCTLVRSGIFSTVPKPRVLYRKHLVRLDCSRGQPRSSRLAPRPVGLGRHPHGVLRQPPPWPGF